jgi:hypothetical protein
MEEFDERHLVGVGRQEANLGEVAMVEAAVARVFPQKEWVMNAMPSPESNAVAVVLKNFLEDRAVLKVRVVVGVEANKEESCGARLSALIRTIDEVLI